MSVNELLQGCAAEMRDWMALEPRPSAQHLLGQCVRNLVDILRADAVDSTQLSHSAALLLFSLICMGDELGYATEIITLLSTVAVTSEDEPDQVQDDELFLDLIRQIGVALIRFDAIGARDEAGRGEAFEALAEEFLWLPRRLIYRARDAE